ncbi:MAG: alpha-N-acetylglucosaminidase C-terminal domain-containing protein, partial [Verrucomicrobiae bacterium]|nr:alpha-N-acetylglucosaminidase C-terminal domain-containing protein [Verrucomicrobiae bacterium]
FGDLFHEGGNAGGLNLTSAATAVQSAMQAAIPGSTWIIQSWGGNPSSSLVAGTDLHHTLIQQLISDMATGEGEGGGFRTYQGRPWTWNEISNFGGNNGLYGNLRVLANLPNQLLAPDNLGRFSGLGVFMEAIELNPIYFDLLTDMVWRSTPPDLETWLIDALRRRYGATNADAEQAWALLRASVYDVPVFQYGVTDFVIAARPGPNVSKARLWGDNRRYWNPWDVSRAAESMLAAAPALGGNEAFRFDLIDVLRQALNDYTFVVYQKMMDAYQSADATRFEAEAARLLTAFDQLDALLATHPQWMIGPWIADARAKSSDPATRELMETNARQLVTTWTPVDNPGLNDYASRSRSGLVGDYYKHRWEIYIGNLRDALAGNGIGNYTGVAFEQGWRSDRSVTYPTTPSTDTIAVANQLWATIGADISATAMATGRWRWSLTQGGTTETFTWDLTDLIAGPTRLAVIFDYQSGAHALQIDELELLRNGTRIAIDTHDGWTGSIDDDHAYSLAFTSAHTPGDSYTLRATVSGAGGGDSTGVLDVSVPGPITDDSFVGRFRRNSAGVGQHETLDLNADHTLQRHVNGIPVATYDGYSWDQTDGLLAIRDASGTIVSFHTLTGPDSFTTNDGRMDRLATSVVVAEWAQGLGLTAPDDAADADPDGDRLSNSLE